MKITVNGKEISFTEGLTLNKLLIRQKIKMPEMVSVELNGRILKRPDFDRTILKNADKVEFLYFMGGGSGTE